MRSPWLRCCLLALLLAPACSWIAPFSSAPGDAGGPDHGDSQMDLPGADGQHDGGEAPDLAPDGQHDGGEASDLAADSPGDTLADAGPPQLIAPTCDDAGWCWRHPLPQGNTLRGVWGLGPTFVIAVGAGTVLRYDGSAWHTELSSDAWDLHDVWGIDPTDVYAAGGSLSGGSPAPGVVLHRGAGVTWNVDTAVLAPLRGVWAQSDGATAVVIAVGDGGTMLRKDNALWSPIPSIVTTDLEDVWGFNPTSVFAVGANGTLLHGGHGGWGQIPLSTTVTLRAVSGNGAQVVAAGDEGKVWVGPQWQPLTPLLDAVAATVAWVDAGGEVCVGTAQPAAEIQCRKAGAWEAEALPRPVLGLWGDGAGALYAVGEQGLANRRQGGLWRPLWRAAAASFDAFWAVSPSELLAVGAPPATFHHYVGGRWQTEPVLHPVAGFRALWAESATDVVAVGLTLANTPFVARFDGGGWGMPWVGSVGAKLHDVWGCGPSDIHAVGSSGAVVAFDGSTWSAFQVPSASMLHAIWSPCATGQYFAVGSMQHAYRGRGTDWHTIDTPGTTDLYAVHGTSAQQVWAAGSNGVVLGYQGGTFTAHSTCAINVRALWARGPSEIYALGGPELRRFDGSQWSSLSTPNHQSSSWRGVSGRPTAIFVLDEQGGLLSRPLP